MGLIASVLALFPTGDLEGRNVAIHQPEKLAAMEGLFESQEGAELILIGQPDMVPPCGPPTPTGCGSKSVNDYCMLPPSRQVYWGTGVELPPEVPVR